MKPVKLRSAYAEGRFGVLLFAGLSIVSFTACAFRLAVPPELPYRGRFALVVELLSVVTGKFTPAVLWFAVGLFWLVIARFVWRHTSKAPHEHLV
jgi:hypothetical protein